MALGVFLLLYSCKPEDIDPIIVDPVDTVLVPAVYQNFKDSLIFARLIDMNLDGVDDIEYEESYWTGLMGAYVFYHSKLSVINPDFFIDGLTKVDTTSHVDGYMNDTVFSCDSIHYDCDLFPVPSELSGNITQIEFDTIDYAVCYSDTPQNAIGVWGMQQELIIYDVTEMLDGYCYVTGRMIKRYAPNFSSDMFVAIKKVDADTTRVGWVHFEYWGTLENHFQPTDCYLGEPL